MIRASPALTLYFLLICLLIASAMGTIAGVVASFFLKHSMRGLWKDALVGALGFLVSFVARVAFASLGAIRSSINADDGLPLKAGLFVAAVIPILRHALQAVLRSTQKTPSPSMRRPVF